jgi:hypothetical protein
MEFKNLTSKLVKIIKRKDGETSYTHGDYVDPSGEYAKVEYQVVGVDKENMCKLVNIITHNLPEPKEGVTYIVSNEVRKANLQRKDLMTPGSTSYSHQYDSDGTLKNIDRSRYTHDSVLLDLGDSRPPKKEVPIKDMFPWLKNM